MYKLMAKHLANVLMVRLMSHTSSHFNLQHLSIMTVNRKNRLILRVGINFLYVVRLKANNGAIVHF